MTNSPTSTAATQTDTDANIDPPHAQIKTLMLIDDNSVDHLMYKRIIQKSGLVQTYLPFQEATKALDYLRSGTAPQPDVILLDINMPVMNGFDFLDATTQEFGADFCVIIVMLTTSLDPRDRDRVKSYDAVKRFLNKPLTKALLAELTRLT